MMISRVKNLNLQSYLFIFVTVIFFSFIAVVILSLLYYTSLSTMYVTIQDKAVYSALAVSLKTSIIASSLSLLLGVPVAYSFCFYKFPGKQYLETLLDIPLVMPPLVSGMALLVFFSSEAPVGNLFSESGLSIIFTQKGIIIAQFFVASPFLIKTVRENIAVIPKNILLASSTLKASNWYTFFHVVLPLIRPGIIAGFIMTWARAMAEFGATAMVAGAIPGHTETLTMSIYNQAASGNTNNATSIAVFLMILSFLLLGIVKRFFWRTDGNYS